VKLRILAAASAVVIGGAACAVYRETRPDTAAAAAGSPTPVERAPSSSVPRADEATTAEAPAPATSPASGARTATTPAPALPAPAGEPGERAAATSSPAQPPAGSIVTTRAGLTSIKQPVRRETERFEPGSPEAAIVRQKRMNRTLESAACHAPDIEKRYNQLPENERAALRARCAKYGVTLGNPS
jgi:hypothetical protein